MRRIEPIQQLGGRAGRGMSAPVSLLMAIHCHQPVGNFGFVFEEAYAKAYEPFLRVLDPHPDVRPGPPSSAGRRGGAGGGGGRMEVLAGGYYEPILPLIPEADRQGQIAMMRRAVRKDFG